MISIEALANSLRLCYREAPSFRSPKKGWFGIAPEERRGLADLRW